MSVIQRLLMPTKICSNNFIKVLVLLLTVLVLVVLTVGCATQQTDIDTEEGRGPGIRDWIGGIISLGVLILALKFIPARVISWGNLYVIGGSKVVGGMSPFLVFLVLAVLIAIYLIIVILQLAIWYSLTVLRLILPVFIPYCIYLYFLVKRKKSALKATTHHSMQMTNAHAAPPRPGKPTILVILAAILWFVFYIGLFIMAADGTLELLFISFSMIFSEGLLALIYVFPYIRTFLYVIVLLGGPALIITLLAKKRYREIYVYDITYGGDKALRNLDNSQMFIIFATLLWLLYYITMQIVLQWPVYYIGLHLTYIDTIGSSMPFSLQYIIPSLATAIPAMIFSLKASKIKEKIKQENTDSSNSNIGSSGVSSNVKATTNTKANTRGNARVGTAANTTVSTKITFPVNSSPPDRCKTCGADTQGYNLFCTSCGNLI